MTIELAPESQNDAYGYSFLPSIRIESPAFSGSLANLLHSVKNYKVNLVEVPLHPLCAAYYSYLIEQSESEYEIAAAALAALAYLVERKTLMLLPKPELQEELEEEINLLTRQSFEFETVIESLRILAEEREEFHFREIGTEFEQYQIEQPIQQIPFELLTQALLNVLQRAKPDPEKHLAIPRRSLGDQMKIVMARLEKKWQCLEDLLEENFTRSDVMWSFLALLELIRLGQAIVTIQEKQVYFSRANRPLSLQSEETAISL